MLTTSDLSSFFLSFWQQAASAELATQKTLWKQLYEEPNQAVFDVYFSKWGHWPNFDSAVQKYQAVADGLATVGDLQTLTQSSLAQTQSLFGIELDKGGAVYFVGLFDSNAWAAPFAGQETVFMALEWFAHPQIFAPHYLPVILTHEFGHMLHTTASGSAWDEDVIGLSLIREGIAVTTTKKLFPEMSEGEHFVGPFGGDEWIAACQASLPTMANEILAQLGNKNQSTFAKYFLMGDFESPVPKRSGYYVGERVVNALLETNSFEEIVRWSPEQALEKMKPALHGLAA